MNRIIVGYRSVFKILASESRNFCSASSSAVSTAKGIRKMGPVEETIRQKLSERFGPVHLDVINESRMHNVPPGSESHFKVVVVSNQFENVPLIQRHRLINDTLKDELACGLHALSIVARTPVQWEDGGHKVEKSPPCLGGSGR